MTAVAVQPAANPLSRTLTTLFITYIGLVTTIQFYPARFQGEPAAIAGVLFTALIALSTLRFLRRGSSILAGVALLTIGLMSVWGHMEVLSPVRLPQIPVLVFPVALILAFAAVKKLISPRN